MTFIKISKDALKTVLHESVRRGSAPILLFCIASLISGCKSSNINTKETIHNDTSQVDAVMCEVDYGTTHVTYDEAFVAPLTLNSDKNLDEITYRDMTLGEVMSVAMSNSKVLKGLRAQIIRAPATVSTEYQLALQETDPRFGVEAALSAFDAQFITSMLWQDNHRVYNNRFLGGGTNNFTQQTHDYISQISKYTATGSQLSVRNITDYDANNAPGNLFGSAWQSQFEAEIRQPLLQGGGLTFNRIAGPGATPGVNNGILIAKVNSDINSVEFEQNLRNYISDVVNAYWDLYFSYRDLDAKQESLKKSRETWKAYQAKKSAGDQSSVAEALAREQFYRFQSELQDSIAGRVGQRTHNENGATGGASRGLNGVQAAERRLRLLIGMAINDHAMIRPIEEPEKAPVEFDWSLIVSEALQKRPELKKQRLVLKRHELDYIAAKNHLAPRLDAIGRYRVRGLGKDLIGGGTNLGLGSAASEVGSFEYNEWEMGLEFSVPIGFRRQYAAVKNAEYRVARDRAILKEQERQVYHDLSVEVAETTRAFDQIETNMNRYLAARDALDALLVLKDDEVDLDRLLDAQRRVTEAQVKYALSKVDYAIALKNVQLEKGSLLEYYNMYITDPSAPVNTMVKKSPEESTFQATSQIASDLNSSEELLEDKPITQIDAIPEETGNSSTRLVSYEEVFEDDTTDSGNEFIAVGKPVEILEEPVFDE